MKKVLIISAFFPPIGGVGVQRITKFVNYLPEHDWKPIVLTIPQKGHKLPIDKKMLEEIDPQIKIFRAFYFDYSKIIPGDIRKFLRSIFKNMEFPDKYKHWNYFAFKKIIKILSKKKIDLIIINSSPFSTIAIAKNIKEKFNIPIILNLRDPFSFNSYTVLKKIEKKKQKAIIYEKEYFPYIDKIACVTPYMVEQYKKILPMFKEKFMLITNGFDKKDFNSENLTEKNTEEFIIGYNGSFSKIVPLYPLLQAINSLNKNYGTKIKLSIATNKSLKKLIKQHEECYNNGYIDYFGFLTHKNSIKRLQKADILFVSFADTEATKGAYPVKVLEYLYCKKPILLLNNKHSIIAKLIQKTKTGFCVNINDQEEIEKTLLSLYNEWKINGKIKYDPDYSEINKFDYRHIVKQLSDLMSELI